MSDEQERPDLTKDSLAAAIEKLAAEGGLTNEVVFVMKGPSQPRIGLEEALEDIAKLALGQGTLMPPARPSLDQLFGTPPREKCPGCGEVHLTDEEQRRYDVCAERFFDLNAELGGSEEIRLSESLDNFCIAYGISVDVVQRKALRDFVDTYILLAERGKLDAGHQTEEAN